MIDEAKESIPEPSQNAPVVNPEAVKEISEVITEGIQKAISTPEPSSQDSAPVAAEEIPMATLSESPRVEIESEPESLTQPQNQSTTPASATQKSSAGARMREVVIARRQARLEKVMVMAREKGIIYNDDVEKLLKVSDATATRYLNALVLAARLRRSGHDGGAKYEPI